MAKNMVRMNVTPAERKAVLGARAPKQARTVKARSSAGTKAAPADFRVSFNVNERERRILLGLLHFDRSMKNKAFGEQAKRPSRTAYNAAQNIIDKLRDKLRTFGPDPYAPKKEAAE